MTVPEGHSKWMAAATAVVDRGKSRNNYLAALKAAERQSAQEQVPDLLEFEFQFP